MRARALTGVLAGLSLASPAQPQIMMDVPAPDVMIGKDGPEVDACGAIGVVIAPEATATSASEMVDVFNSTQSWRNRLDRLPAGRAVWLCDTKAEWVGIVYPDSAAGELGDCDVASPVPAPRVYRGPCRSGWVLAARVQVVAG
jgi:hypothetical protein